MDICAKTIYNSAKQIQPEMVSIRRTLHRHPEIGTCLPNTKEFVKNQLFEMGYEPVEICESGIVASISGAAPGRCILLRADMDGLNIREMTELEYKSENGYMHACGHDMHTAMLLGAARLLRNYQSKITGTIKLVFQPDEEGFTGAKAMLKAGVLEQPVPEAGMALHVHSGTPSGLILCGQGTTMAGCTLFRISVKGIGCHGAMPENGVDPINIAAHIHLALQEITAREIAAKTPAVITIGKFSGGQAPNIIPQDAVIEGTIRTFDKSLSAEILQRITVISKATAEAFRGTVTVEELSSAPPLINNPQLTSQMTGFITELFGEKSIYLMDGGGMGSEDFSSFTYELPCVYLLIGAGTAEENPQYGMPMHNEKVIFNEEILAKGAAIHTYCALKWLCDE